MSKRFLILETSNHVVDYNVIHEAVVDSRAKAINAFRTLYAGQGDFILVEQIACDPAGSHTEADDSSGSISLFKTERLLDNLSSK